MTQLPVPWLIPIVFNVDNEPVYYTPLEEATGAQLALALVRLRDERTWRHHALYEVWRRFRDAGGRAEDKIGGILKL